MCHATLLLLLIVPQAPSEAAEPSTEADASRLVRQLGSVSFKEREAATRALRALGERALVDLRAVKKHPDPEVRSRSTRLIAAIQTEAKRRKLEPVKRRIVAIRTSNASLEEKAHKLKGFLKGKTRQEVGDLLDLDGLKVSELPFDKIPWFRSSPIWIGLKDCRLRIIFVWPKEGKGWLVDNIEPMPTELLEELSWE